MRLDRHIVFKRIVDLKSRELKAALSELLDLCELPESGVSHSDLVDELLVRERQMTTYLGDGVCLPHARIQMDRPYVLAVGRCAHGLDYEDKSEYKQVRIIFLLLAAKRTRTYMVSLSELAGLFREPAHLLALRQAESLADFRRTIRSIVAGDGIESPRKQTRFNYLILREGAKIARGADCASVLIFADTFAGGVDVGKVFRGFKTVLITQGTGDQAYARHKVDAILPVRAYGNQRFSQLRSAVLVGLTRGIFARHDRICCVGGMPRSNQFDSITVVDVAREFQNLLAQKNSMLPPTVKPEVLERVLAIATELAVEGREGHPVGCLFVVGDAEAISEFTKPLILNPFFGYKHEDRNLLNPFMDETVKELSSIDGAFVIRGDGVLASAGSLIAAPEYQHNLPGGLGSRHAAAAAITQVVDCLCIVVSGSTGQVTLFRGGEMLPLIEKTLLSRP